MKKRIIYIAVLSVLLAACGGGDSSSSPIPQNKTFNVSASIASGEGAVTPPQQSIEQGKTTTLNLSPKEGYQIASASGCNGTLKNNVYTTGAITADCQVQVGFELLNENIEVIVKTIKPLLSTDVSLADSKKITKIHSFASTVKTGEELVINVAEPNKQGLLIASDDDENPLLLSIENNAEIGVDSTAYALVIMATKFANLPEDLDSDTVAVNIRKVNSYQSLKELVSQNLNQNIVSVDSPEVIELALKVLDDATRLNVPTTRSVAQPRVITENQITFPIYFFNVDSATEKMWLSGATADGLDLKNRTFLKWQVVLENENKKQLFKDYIVPMNITTAQLLAYYAGSESSLKIPTTLIKDRFRVEVSQTVDTETTNALTLVNRTVFAIIDLSLGAVGVKAGQVESCALEITKTLTNSNQFATAIRSTNLQDWLNYFKTIGDRVPELLGKTCNSQITKGLGLENANSATKKLYKRFISTFTLARDVNATISGFAQFNRHYHKSYAVDLCFANGEVRLCNYTKISATGEKLPNSAEEWSCVLDNETELMWEEKTNDGGIRDYRYQYTWYGDFPLKEGYLDPKDGIGTDYNTKQYGYYCGNTLAKCNTQDFVKAVNKQNLCGYSDWRLPSKGELVQIGQEQQYKVDFFRYASGYSFWSATGNGYNKWYVFFDDGESNHTGLAAPFHVRLVRDNCIASLKDSCLD